METIGYKAFGWVKYLEFRRKFARLGFLVRLEHARGDTGYEAPRNESLSEHAEIISHARNDIALAGCERTQTRSRHFFRGLAIRSRGSDM